MLPPPGRSIDSTPTRLRISKARWAIEAYEEVLAGLRPERIFEFGILDGGSVAMMSLLARPEKLAAADISPQCPPALAGFIAANDLQERIGLHFGVAQDDGAAIGSILADEFEGSPLDLVIDDASHDLVKSRTSFDLTFPRLRAGGLYLLEDWSWAHAWVVARPEQPPLTLMVFQLLLACASNPDLIRSVDVNRGWALVERGPAELEVGSFSLSRSYGERAASLIRSAEGEPETARRGLRRLRGLLRH